MRSVTSAVAALAFCVFMAPVAQGLGVHQDFNGYTVPGSSSAWYYMINNGPATGVYIGDADAGAGVDPAAYFYLNNNNFVVAAGANPAAAGNKVYFETYSTLSAGVAANLFSSAIGVVGQGTPASAVSAIEYYLYVDTVGNDNLADSYYTSTLSLAGSPGVLQTYPTRSLTDNTATWHRYDWNGTGWGGVGFEADVTSISSAITNETIALGLQFDLLPFTPTGPDYMTIWVDNVFTDVVPEPSGLLLACFGALGVLARRGRRRNA